MERSNGRGGKWRRAGSLGEARTARTTKPLPTSLIPGCVMAPTGDPSTAPTPRVPMRGTGATPKNEVVILDAQVYEIITDLIDCLNFYTMGATNLMCKDGKPPKAVPFIHRIHLHGPKGEINRIKSIFDDGAMINTIDSNIFNVISHQLTPTSPSTR